MSALHGLAPISLAEVAEQADLQTRVDRKYLVPVHEVEALVAEVLPAARVLTIDGLTELRYESVYFDTPDLVAYRGAAGRRRRRFKVRTRAYLDSGTVVLEVKTRGGRGETIKERITHDPNALHRLDRAAVAFVDEQIGEMADSTALRPTLTTRYLRTTLVDPAVPMRLTIDRDLRFVTERGSAGLDGLAVVETKALGHATPADRWLWSRGHRPQALSKYAIGVAALHGLPGNRWRRPLAQVG